jgi:hypothetical protein
MFLMSLNTFSVTVTVYFETVVDVLRFVAPITTRDKCNSLPERRCAFGHVYIKI